MTFLLLAPFALYLSITDVRSHRIPNIGTLTLSILLFLTHDVTISLFQSFITIYVALFLYAINVGMGDIKLLVVLTVFFSRVIMSMPYLSSLFVCGLITWFSLFLHRRERVTRIPLAPAIFASLAIGLLS